MSRNIEAAGAPIALLVIYPLAQHHVIRSHRRSRDVPPIIDSEPVLGAGVPIPTPEAPEKPAKRLVDRWVPGHGVVRMGHTVLVPVLRGDELNEALVAHPRAAERVKVAGVAGLPQVYRRDGPNGRAEGVPGHDEGVVGIRLERGPDGLVDAIRDIFPRIVEAAVHLAVGHGQPSVGALKQFGSAFKQLYNEFALAAGGCLDRS